MGCGAGKTSIAIADARPDAEVIGLDLSPDLIAVAIARARGRDKRQAFRFFAGNAVDRIAALAPVDFFFSRYGVMFFDDPVASLVTFAKTATPGGGLVFSCFAALADNPWAGLTATAAGAPASSPTTAPTASPPSPGPFAFADPDYTRSILIAAGWIATDPERVLFPYVAGAGGRSGRRRGLLRHADRPLLCRLRGVADS